MSPFSFPSAQAYKAALALLEAELPPKHRLMLRAHYRAPDHTVTARQLARAVGYGHFGAANLQYGTLGRKLCDVLGLRLRYHVLALAEFVVPEDGPDRELRWVLRPQVVRALEELHWV